MRTLAILPVKRFALAKQRLADDLDAAWRARLAEAMVADVLDALDSCPQLDGTIVVTNEERVQRLAAAQGAHVLEDPQEIGQSEAAQIGIAHAQAQHCQRVLLVPGDCPALDPEELSFLLAQPLEPPSMVIVPDRHGTGTNALLLCPPDAVTPTFGPGSFRRHRDRAFAVGTTAQVQELSSLSLDIDTPRDLRALRAALQATPGGASRTRAVLARLT